MKTHKVIRIQDARDMREVGERPNMPVEDREFSDAAGKLFLEATNAKTIFYRAFADYCKAPATRQRFNRLRKALGRIAVISDAVSDFASPDDDEAAAMKALREGMVGFVSYWEQILALVEEGEPVTVTITNKMFETWAVPSRAYLG